MSAGLPPAPRRAVVVAALGITQILSWGSTYYLPAVLAGPIAAETGWPLTAVVAGLSVGLLVSGLVSPFVGRRIDRSGGRPVLAAASLVLAAGLALLAVAPTLPIYFSAWIVIGAGMGAGLYDPAFSTLGRLYGLQARRAISSLTLWGGFASTVCWPLSAALVAAVGWRGACLAYAGLQLAVALPLHLLFVPRLPPADPARAPRPAPPAAPGRRPILFLLGTLLVIASMISSAISVHLLAILRARGVGLSEAVALGTLIGPAQVAARLAEMLFGTRLHPLSTMAAALGLVAGGVSLLATGAAPAGIALVLFGAGNGIFSIARGTLPLALFGADGYATTMGRLALPALVAAALSPALAAALLAENGPEALVAAIAAAGLANVGVVGLLNLVQRRGRRRGGALTL